MKYIAVEVDDNAADYMVEELIDKYPCVNDCKQVVLSGVFFKDVEILSD
jgi:hypothetical protein